MSRLFLPFAALLLAALPASLSAQAPPEHIDKGVAGGVNEGAPPAPSSSADYGYGAAWTPLQIGVVGRYQLFNRETPVEGLALGVFGVHAGKSNGIAIGPIYTDVAGVPLAQLQAAGILNITSGDHRGIQAGGLGNSAEGHVTGLQAAGLGNFGGDGVDGVQLSLLANITEGPTRGMQAAAVNSVTGRADAFQFGLIGNHVGSLSGDVEEAPSSLLQASLVYNHSDSRTETRGAMITGICNWAEKGFSGLQVGLVNLTGEMRGLQIGLLNDSEDLHGLQLGLFNFHEGRMRLPLVNFRLGKGGES